MNVVCLLGVVTVLSLALGGLVFGPIRDLGEPRREEGVGAPVREMRQSFQQPLRFRIIDLLALLVQLQITLALLAPDGQWGAMLYVLLQTSIWWLEGLRMLSLANVQSAFDRAWFLGLLVPLGFIGVTLLVAFPVAVLAAIAFFVDDPGDPRTYVQMMVVLGAVACHLGILYGLRLLCGTLVTRTRQWNLRSEGPPI